jgi:tetratricopeptide (TPR) repeat protein
LAERFCRLREAVGLNKSGLAAPRYTLSYVSQIESGRRVPSDEAFAYFAERLNVSASYLKTGIPDDAEERLAYAIEESRAALRSGEPALALTLAEGVVEESARYGFVAMRARALVLAGDGLLMLARLRESIDRYEEAFEDGLTEREAAVATASLAAAYRNVGDLSYAAQLIESTIAAHRPAPLEPSIRAELQSVLLSIYFERGDVTKAERVAQQALSAAAEGVSPATRANVLWSTSRILAEAKQWDEALELATEARIIIEGFNERFRLARVHIACAFLCNEADPPRLEEAERHLADAEQLYGDDAPSRELAYLFAERGRLALLTDQPVEALTQSERALSSVADDQLERARCLFLRGRARARLQQLDDAMNDFLEAAASFEKLGARQQVASCYREIGEIEAGDGDLHAAVEAFRAGLHALEPRRSRA